MTNQIQQPPPLPGRRVSRLALAAVALGLLSLGLGMFGVLTGLLGVGLGLLALRHIRRDARLTGRKLAITGLMVSCVAVALAIVIYDWSSLFHETPRRKIHFSGPAR